MELMWRLHTTTTTTTTTTTMEDDRESTFTTTKDFIQVKVDHFKAKAKNALEGGRYKEAYETYTKCLEVLRVGDGAERSKVLCNRSMAYVKAANFKLALKDADTAVALTPTFGKAWWRKGAAHVGLRQYPLALAAYKMSLKHQPQVDRAIEEEHVKVMNRTISQFTREQIGEWVLEVLDDYEAREMMKPAHLETVTSLEMTEAMFCQVKDIDEMSKKPGDYYRFVQHWNMYPMSLAMAYTQRASMYRHALCFKQARADAAMALVLLQDDPSLALTDDEMFFTYKKDSFTRVYTEAKVITKAWAWYELGKAYEEQRGTGDQRSAAKCFSAVTELPTDYPTFANAFKIMCEGMKDVDMGRVLSDVNDQYEATEYGLRTVPKATAYIVSIHAHFPHGSLVKFDSHVRDEFRSCVADAAEIKKQDVLIESVKQSLINGVKCIVVKYRILVGEVEKKAQELMAKIQARDELILGGTHATTVMGEPSEVFGEIKELRTEELVERVTKLQDVILSTLKSGKEVVVASRPPMDMQLPYKTYKLVYNDGTPVERVNKSAYCMSQVHYSAQGMHKREVWAEIMDKSCRWHQSSSEIVVQALRVPKDATKEDLDVCITSSTVRVACEKTGQIYLQGELLRPIIPEESAWVHLGGEDDDGFVLYLKKMNLELFKSKLAQPSDSWWERLFTAHGEIQFDDYDKDFTDLPAPIAESICAREAEQNIKNKIDDFENHEREVARELDDVRKRNRQVRLAELRSGKYLSWVELDRRNPGKNELAPQSQEAQ